MITHTIPTEFGHPVSAVVVAAGSGTRMGGISKPEIKLHGKPLLLHVLDAFFRAEVSEIIVVCGSNRSRLEALAPENPPVPVRFCAGGAVRSESVFRGVCAASRSSDYICVHDCARPFVTPELIDETIREAIRTGAASACSPVTDTVKYVDEERHVIYTPVRKHLIAMQTPQVFRKDQYRAAYAIALRKKADYTDETAMLEAAGVKVAYVRGPASNIKLTTKEDLLLARAIVLLREKENRTKGEQP